MTEKQLDLFEDSPANAFYIHDVIYVISMSPQPHSPTDPVMDYADSVVRG